MEKEILEAARHCVQCNAPLYDCRDCGAGDPLKFAKAIADHHEKYRWHDLRKDPDDLPYGEGKVNVCVWIKPNNTWGIGERYTYDTYHFCGKFKTAAMSEVVAWREIEPFESED